MGNMPSAGTVVPRVLQEGVVGNMPSAGTVVPCVLQWEHSG